MWPLSQKGRDTMTDNQQLVPVFTGELQDKTVQLCNARDLWNFIESKRDFSTWIKERIEKYDFTEGEDYLLHKFGEQVPHQGGMRTMQRIDYHLTIDMAKELAMVENNDKGKQVRRYFIAMEEKAREATSRRLPSISQQLAAHNTRLKLLDKLERERHPEKRRAIHQQLDHASRMLGLPTPAMDAIGYAVAPDPVPALVDDFWEAVEFIGLDKLNHSRDPRFIAINLPHLARVAADEKLKLPATLEFRRVLARSEDPRYLEHNKAIKSRLHNRTVKCWVFAAELTDQ